MPKRTQEELLKDIEDNFTKNVSGDTRFTIMTIRNLIESNARVEDSVDELHKSINRSNVENDKLQKRIFWLTMVGIGLAVIQVLGLILQLK